MFVNTTNVYKHCARNQNNNKTQKKDINKNIKYWNYVGKHVFFCVCFVFFEIIYIYNYIMFIDISCVYAHPCLQCCNADAADLNSPSCLDDKIKA